LAAKLRERYRDITYASFTLHISAFPFIHISFRVVHIFQLLNQHWHAIVTPCSKFTLGFSLGYAPFCGMDKVIMTYPPL
jgi:hypothetical protein